VQEPPSNEALQGIDAYEQMVNTFTEQARAYWGLWGPPGEVMANKGWRLGRRCNARISSGSGKPTKRGIVPNTLPPLIQPSVSPDGTRGSF